MWLSKAKSKQSLVTSDNQSNLRQPCDRLSTRPSIFLFWHNATIQQQQRDEENEEDMIATTTPQKHNKDSSVDTTLHRIYVGGINPPKLTVETVEQRMKSTLGNRIEFVSFDHSQGKGSEWGEDSRTFFFVSARGPKIGDEETAVNPTDLLVKEYHNVKWKGCTLKVEPAKLSFLDRLKVEREHAMKEELSRKDELNLKNSIETLNEGTQPKIKRQLNIRKRHGEEKYVGMLAFYFGEPKNCAFLTLNT